MNKSDEIDIRFNVCVLLHSWGLCPPYNQNNKDFEIMARYLGYDHPDTMIDKFNLEDVRKLDLLHGSNGYTILKAALARAA